MISYNQLISVIQLFATQHEQVQRFGAEFKEQLPNIQTSGTTFPYLFMVPVGTTTSEFVKEIEVEIYCVDRLRKDRANTNDVVSDTEQILTDLGVWLENEQDYVGIVKSYTATPVNNATLDYVDGWIQRYRFELERIGACEIPIGEGGLPVNCPEFEDVTVNINGEEVATAGSGETVDLNVTLNGTPSGSWNAGTGTWEVIADLPPKLPAGTYYPSNDGSGGLTWIGATANVTTGDGTISKVSGSGAWDGSAYSLVNHYGDFELFFNVTSGNEAMMGISYYKSRPGFENLDIAFYCSIGNSFAWENGSNKEGFGPFNSSTLFSIQRSGSNMHYKVDGSVLRTVPITNIGPINIDTSIYDLSTISNIQLVIP